MGTLNVDGDRRIYFEWHEGDGGRPTVMLIHGWAASCRVWDTTLPALLRAGYSVATFDQRCGGKSDKDFRANSIDASAGDAVTILDRLGCGKVILNGWSFGAAVAVEAATRLRGRCAGVISTAGATPRYTSAADFPYGTQPAVVEATVAAIRADRVGMLANVAGAVCAAEQSPAFIQWLTSIFLEMSPGGDVAMLDLAALDQREKLAALDAPFLSVVGGKDAFVEPAIGRLAALLAPRGEVVEFPDCGHAPFLEDGDGYRAALLNFLAKCR